LFNHNFEDVSLPSDRRSLAREELRLCAN